MASGKKANTGRDTLVKLRAHVDSIEKRLKRANSLTRTSVKSLQTAYESLGQRSGHSAADISAPITQLSNHLTGLIEQTRKDVAHDLRIVMDDPRLETITAALTKANQRLTRAERKQAEAIGAINNQIADIARAVDKRISAESSARARMNSALKTRIDQVEAGSIEGIQTIGNKVADVTNAISRRAGEHAETLIKQASEQALTQQASLEEHRADIDRRLESIEDDQRNTMPAIERRLITLSTRLEALEGVDHDISETMAPPPLVFQPAPQDSLAAQTIPEDAFSPSAILSNEVPEIAEPELELVVEGHNQEGVSEADAEPESPSIVEYDPTLYEPVTYEPATPAQHYVPDVPTTNLQDMSPPDSSQPYGNRVDTSRQVPTEYTAAFNPQTAYETPVAVSPPFNDAPPMPAAGSDQGLDPYTPSGSDVAEAEETMNEARPGAEPTKKRSKWNRKNKAAARDKKAAKIAAKAAKNTISNHGVNDSAAKPPKAGPVRMLALMAGVAVIGLFAAKTVMPDMLGSFKKKPTQERPQNDQGQPVTTAQSATNPNTARPITSVEPVGSYAGAQAPVIAPSVNGQPSQQARTLEAAAAAGHPIAQFQLGLSHLEAGREADAVRLIRLSADQGQAAAQYRLGKLYEAGIGVKANPQTAMKLLSLAATGDNSVAMHDLGHYYATGGNGVVAPDINKAAMWFHKAAERGWLDSQFNLGVLYQEGSGVKHDLVESYVWFSLAAAQGDDIAMQRAKFVNAEMNSAQKTRADARFKAFVPKQANAEANGIFQNLPWAPAVAANTIPAASVKSAQHMLGQLGYNVGTPDGAMGPKTRNAIMSFERANGLPETGRVNAALIGRLNLAVGA